MAIPVLVSCSKSKNSNEPENETFQTINACIYDGTSATRVGKSLNIGVGGKLLLYVGNGSTKEIFNGSVKWTASGSGEVTLTSVSRTSSVAPPSTKAGYDYGSTTATTNVNTVLQIVGKSDGLITLKAADPVRNAINIVINIYAIGPVD
ncbi:MAG: hypothetical protein IK041_09290 [Bacteroidales bacterium]|nr:hypothetical protein [Bacteroidales bacterium]